MSTLCDVLRATLPRFSVCTSLTKVSAASEVYALTVLDSVELTKVLTECVEQIEGVRWYDDNDEYRRLCESSGITSAQLFSPRPSASRKQLRKIQLGDLGELLGCLTLAAHFGIDPDALFARNLAKPSALKSESGYDIAVIKIDLADTGDVHLGGYDEFRAVESKVSNSHGVVALVSTAQRSFEQDIQEVQKLLQMYMHFAAERFGGAAAVHRIPSFLFELYQKTAKFSFCSVATTPLGHGANEILSVAEHLAAFHQAMAVLCTLDGSAMIKEVYKFREQAS